MSERTDTLVAKWLGRCMTAKSMKHLKYATGAVDRRKLRLRVTQERRKVISLAHLSANLTARKLRRSGSGPKPA